MRLFAKRHLIIWRNTHVTGQRASTRAITLIETVSSRVRFHQRKYNRAHEAMVSLIGEKACVKYRVLEDKDLTLDVELIADAVATRKLGEMGSTRTRVHGRREQEEEQGTKKKGLVSWIWTGVGDEKDEERMNEGKSLVRMFAHVLTKIAVRVEWSKALARKERWEEEVLLLEEEMHRVLRSLHWEEQQWLARAKEDFEYDDITAAGHRAYALRQAFLARSTMTKFKKQWSSE